MEEILPKCDVSFSPFEVPMFFVAFGDVKSLMQKTRQETIKTLQHNLSAELWGQVRSQLESSPDTPELDAKLAADHDLDADHEFETGPELDGLKLKGNEVIRNQRLHIWLHEQLSKQPEKYIIFDNQTSEHSYTRHHRSMDDFGWFIEPGNGVSCSNLQGASVTVIKEFKEQVHLFAGGGDCKEESADKDKYQLLANMNKTAGDIAYRAVIEHILFETITVFGLLVDYKEESITTTYKAVLDFNNGRTMVKSCDKKLELAKGFSCVTALLKNPMVSV